ncbi:MAG: transporter substrate-binding domain-containing protein [Alphaproteobacteria bacterium]|nr:transporter substrate-binding domain-containing protein [Alphaproteobacteria bacterium]
MVTKFLLSALALMTVSLAPPASAADKESAFERIMRTGTIRCGYFVIPPEFMKDPNTGEFSGIGYDVMNAIGEALHLKIEWTEEAPFSGFVQGLESGRYDAVCATVWNRADLSRMVDFSMPIMYTPVNTFVRADETRFSGGPKTINDPEVTIVTMDGEASSQIANLYFPKAKRISLPENSHVSQLLESVATGKADVAFTYMGNFVLYNETNPEKLKVIHQDAPVRAYGNSIVIPKGEYKLKTMLDAAIEERLNSGQINSIIDKYQRIPGTYLKVTTPYRTHAPEQ